MSSTRNSPGLTSLLMFCVLFALGAYFTFAAVQGDFGIFRRVQVEAEVDTLRAELDMLEAQVAEMRNKTRRMSDGYLDLDLLDMQAREILGLMRADAPWLRKNPLRKRLRRRQMSRRTSFCNITRTCC